MTTPGVGSEAMRRVLAQSGKQVGKQPSIFVDISIVIAANGRTGLSGALALKAKGLRGNV